MGSSRDASEGHNDPITIAEVKAIAERKLSKAAWKYYEDGADDQVTSKRNYDVYKDLVLRPRVLRNVTHIDTSTTIFNSRYEIPIAIAPSAYQKLASPGGEIDMALASAALGTNLTLSSNATTSLEDVATALKLSETNADGSPRAWFQLYFVKNRDATKALIQRAEKAGYEALVLTVDTPVMGNRVHERHDSLKLPPGIQMANKTSRKAGGVSKGRLLLNAPTASAARQVIAEHGDALTDSGLTWDEAISWLRSQTKMKIVLKGIMTAEDALKAIEAQVDGIVVSNHGGRQLDGVPATLEVLPEISDAVQRRIPIIFDGGIGRSSDVFKALALGTDLCLIGRSALWGLAYDGQNGVEAVLHILERELSRTMALAGAATVKDISRSMLGPTPAILSTSVTETETKGTKTTFATLSTADTVSTSTEAATSTADATTTTTEAMITTTKAATSTDATTTAIPTTTAVVEPPHTASCSELSSPYAINGDYYTLYCSSSAGYFPLAYFTTGSFQQCVDSRATRADCGGVMFQQDVGTCNLFTSANAIYSGDNGYDVAKMNY
ncbi:FMN-dependent dehydrogenase [Fusarium austroafricanum]|uniref:FMN-dependent dehydrogenase n=1 Tax=Fusarium austroafricanum TaxID=2364996 RepID=A0A8H4KU68_9HYPO|nr:FMN-dependent dehydrogenase [Fusarium austroafricanum]